jgi:hypothetical protein
MRIFFSKIILHKIQFKNKHERTQFENTSTVEILPGTISAVNGPHGQKVHRDEVELMDAETFKEANNISSSKIIIEYDDNGKEIKKIEGLVMTSAFKSVFVDICNSETL